MLYAIVIERADRSPFTIGGLDEAEVREFIGEAGALPGIVSLAVRELHGGRDLAGEFGTPRAVYSIAP